MRPHLLVTNALLVTRSSGEAMYDANIAWHVQNGKTLSPRLNLCHSFAAARYLAPVSSVLVLRSPATKQGQLAADVRFVI